MFVVYKCAITDAHNELLDSGGPVAVFSSMEAANGYIDNIEESYMNAKSDYDVEELKLDAE